MAEQEIFDVVVVGGGISGLCAARRLAEAGKSVAVLEAADRVGGRTMSAPVAGAVVDLGGQWLAPKAMQPHIHALVEELGIGLCPQYHTGRKLLEQDGRVMAYRTDIPSPLGVLGLLDLQVLLWRIDWYRKQVPREHPHLCPRAQEWDGETAQSALQRLAWTRGAKSLATAAVRGVFGVEPCDLSFLHFLWYINCAGGVDALVNIRDGFQMYTCRGGAQQISEGLRRAVERAGGRVHLGSPVSAIAQDDEGVVVTTVAPAGPRTVRASCLVFAAPPSATARVAFSPALPLARQQLADRCYVGSIVKCIIVYRTAFWREAGMSGEVIGDGSGGPIFQVFDDCLPLLAAAAAGTEHAAGTSASHLPALVAFLNGDMGRSGASMPAPKRQQAVLQQLARWFGAQALEPVQFLEKDWCSDPWTQGCPIGIWPPGVLWQHGHALRLPCGRVHWAATETALATQGFMDGAVSAGQRAAAEVLQRLSGDGKLTPAVPDHYFATRRLPAGMPPAAAVQRGVVTGVWPAASRGAAACAVWACMAMIVAAVLLQHGYQWVDGTVPLA